MNNTTILLNELNHLYTTSVVNKTPLKCTLEHVNASLINELNDKTVKKDKKQVINHVLTILNYFDSLNLLKTNVLFEKTNTNRKASKNVTALRFNTGVLFEILLNIAVDYNNNNLKNCYSKQPMKEVDITINKKNYEVKVVSKYSLSAPKHNKIQTLLVFIINDNGIQLKEIPTSVVEWHYCNENTRDKETGEILETKKKRQVALNQPSGLIRTDLMRLLGL